MAATIITAKRRAHQLPHALAHARRFGGGDHVELQAVREQLAAGAGQRAAGDGEHGHRGTDDDEMRQVARTRHLSLAACVFETLRSRV
jgi:hypothetical protein